jgi:putative membrane protein
MEGKKNRVEIYLKIFLVIMFSVGIAGHLINEYYDLFLILTPYTLLLLGAVVFYSEANGNYKLFLWGVPVFLITFILEVAGVSTKAIFGNYNYGDVLGVKLFGVPVIIGFNWVLVILGAINASSFLKNDCAKVLSASVLAVIFDILLEPVAMKLGYWNWAGGIIPLQNYIVWFLIALVSSYYFVLLKIRLKYSITMFYLFVQAVFFFAILIFK